MTQFDSETTWQGGRQGWSVTFRSSKSFHLGRDDEMFRGRMPVEYPRAAALNETSEQADRREADEAARGERDFSEPKLPEPYFSVLRTWTRRLRITFWTSCFWAMLLAGFWVASFLTSSAALSVAKLDLLVAAPR